MPANSIAIAGLRSLREVKLDVGPVTVLIGPNGPGKSNLHSVFRLLTAARKCTPRLHVTREGGASTLLFRGTAPRARVR